MPVLVAVMLLLFATGCPKPQTQEAADETQENESPAVVEDAPSHEADWLEAIRAGDVTPESPGDVPPAFIEAVLAVDRQHGKIEIDEAGNVTAVDLAAERGSGTDAELKLLPGFPHLRKVRVYGVGVTSEGVAALAACKELVEIDLQSTMVDNRGIEALTNLPKLEALGLRRSAQLTDEVIPILLRFPALSRLALLENDFSAEALARLGEMKRLRVLDLRQCANAPAALSSIAALPELVALKLGGYAVDDSCLAPLADCENLRDVTIDEASITQAGLEHLRKRNLTSLTLSKCYSLNDTALEILEAWPELRQLTLRDIPISGSCLAKLANARNLAVLRLSQTMVGDEAMEAVGRLTSLEHLELAQTMVGDAGVEKLQGLEKLTYLDLSGTQLTRNGLTALCALKSLRYLHLNDLSDITDDSILQRECWPHLEGLSVGPSIGTY
ncbi:hypothetical protein JCM19992_10390 [Thermostilla marina]